MLNVEWFLMIDVMDVWGNKEFNADEGSERLSCLWIFVVKCELMNDWMCETRIFGSLFSISYLNEGIRRWSMK